ncbi:SRPBCC family protein [Nonomuraea rosea]|uniref:SRPBCC family protein n=1 Tax=Nonomuraea rosea TaxID=638574 RepID=UPI003CD07172
MRAVRTHRSANAFCDDEAGAVAGAFGELPHPPAKVWRAITQPEHLAHWFPADVTIDGDHIARRSWRDLQHLNVVACEHLIEAAGELRVPIAYQKPERAGPVLQVGEEIAGLLGNPCAVRVGGHAEHVHEPGADLHHEEDVRPAQRDGVHREEVTRQRARGVGAEEIAPAVVGASRCRAQARSFQDAADRRSADLVAQVP